MSRLELMRTSMEDDFALSEADLPGAKENGAPRRFLDFYGDEGLFFALDQYGLLEALRHAGYGAFELRTRADDERHTLLLGARPAVGGEPTNLLELVVRRDRLVPGTIEEGLPPLEPSYAMLTVDWLTLRDPLGRFRPDRPQLPGQDAPGSGLGEQVLEMLYRVVERLHLGGLLTVGEHFHNAWLYGRELRFFDPYHQGQCVALSRALLTDEALTLAQAAWAIEWGFVYTHEAKRFVWHGEAQLRSFSPSLTKFLSSKEHEARSQAHADATVFHLDRAAFQARWRVEAPLLSGKENIRPRLSGDDDGLG